MDFCDIYKIRTDIADYRDFSALLSVDEQKRMDSIKNRLQQKKFIVCRGFLRNTLSSYLKIPADKICFTYGEYGKPLTDGIHFNLTHSHNLCMLAVSGLPVGLDAEYIDLTLDYLKISRRYFSSNDFEKLLAVSGEKQIAAFYKSWCIRESFSKLEGKSIWRTMNQQFSCDLEPDSPARIIYPEKYAKYSFIKINAEENYFCILASQKKISTVNLLFRR